MIYERVCKFHIITFEGESYSDCFLQASQWLEKVQTQTGNIKHGRLEFIGSGFDLTEISLTLYINVEYLNQVLEDTN